jgi:uncharacterized protein (DUF885 family)
MRTLIFLFFIVSIVSCETSKKPNSDNNATLLQLFEDFKDFQFYTYPEFASYEGVHDYSDRLTDQSAAAGEVYMDSIRQFKEILLSIDTSTISEENQLNYELFLFILNEAIDEYELQIGNYLQFNQQYGFHINIPQTTDLQPLETEKDIQNYYSRLKQFKVECGNVIQNLKEGQQKGIVLPCNITTQVLAQLEGLANMPLESSPFYTIHEKNELLKKDPSELKTMIENHVVSGYQDLYQYMKNEYHPKCRNEVGVSGVNGGAKYYEFMVKKHTTSDISPDEVFEIGQKEVARIALEIQKVKAELGYENKSKQAFFEALKTNPEFYYTDKNDLLEGFRAILKNMDAKLPQLFNTLPKTPYDLKEIEAYRAVAAPAAYYYNAPADGSRPGYFYVNTFQLDARPKYTMTALALHEAVPGHHLQIALAKELENVPWFRNQMSVTAFVEGWGLYAEYLGYETDMYKDPLQKLGALTFEMWRACRLVVDVGMHYKGWTREAGIEFLKANVPIGDTDIISEIDRYIAWPGQAVAYKIGELQLKALRNKAQDSLGDKFDIKKFHDELLKNGALPMNILEKKINTWIDNQKSS